MANGTRSFKSQAAHARRDTIRTIVRAVSKKRDGATQSSQGVSYWNGTFQGWESADANLMQILAPDGVTVLRYVATYHHVKADAGAWVSGTTVVRVVQYGNSIWCDGQPVGDPTIAT